MNKKPSPIKPPRSIKQQLNAARNNSTYSLFDSISPSLDWLNTTKRKYSLDNSDSTSTIGYKDAGFWRRASLPNQHFKTMKRDCDHTLLNVCQDCITITNKVLSPSSFTTHLEPSFTISSPFNNSPFSPCSSFVHTDEAFYIGDLLSPYSINSFTLSPINFHCIKLSNIPWDISQKDLKLFFQDFQFPSESMHAQSIHIMMDRMTGKTLSFCYIEFQSEREALRAIEYGNQKLLKNRVISMTCCSNQEFLETVFPKWQSGFNETNPNYSTSSNSFITREEINSMLIICKNYKLHFSRKCAERPFENIITIITKYPWEQYDLISSIQINDIFEMLKSSIDALKLHLSKQVIHIDSSLLQRMVRAGVLCPAFTELQKKSLLQIANIQCPPDIESVMLNSRLEQQQEITDSTQLDNSYIHITQHDNNSLLDILNAAQNGGKGESDEESYFFCENEEDDLSFYKI